MKYKRKPLNNHTVTKKDFVAPFLNSRISCGEIGAVINGKFFTNEEITVSGKAKFECESRFYKSNAELLGREIRIMPGLNRLIGEIDSDVWALTSLLAYADPKNPEDIEIKVGKNRVSLEDIAKVTCCLDTTYPLFKTRKTVRNAVAFALEESGLNKKPDDIRRLFEIEDFRFDRPMSKAGDAIFKAMAAIGYAAGKEIFCLPWMSIKLHRSFGRHITDLLEILESEGKTVIVPIGSETLEKEGEETLHDILFSAVEDHLLFSDEFSSEYGEVNSVYRVLTENTVMKEKSLYSIPVYAITSDLRRYLVLAEYGFKTEKEKVKIISVSPAD